MSNLNNIGKPRQQMEFWTYKVYNGDSIGCPLPEKAQLVMKTKEKKEYVDSVKAVILFMVNTRKLALGKGANFRVACESHNGYVPSLRIKAPICRNTKAEDVAATIGKWKNFTKAKVDAAVQELTEGTGCLQKCGLRKEDGSVIRICPASKSNLGQPAPCKERVLVRCWDLERNRPFDLELSGPSVGNDKRFVSPLFEFIGKLGDKEPYQYDITFSAKLHEKFYILNVGAVACEDSAQVQERAKRAEENYNRYLLNASKASEDAPAQKKEGEVSFDE